MEKKVSIEGIPRFIASGKQNPHLEDLQRYVKSVYLPLLEKEDIPLVFEAAKHILDNQMEVIPHFPVRRLSYEDADKMLEECAKLHVSNILVIGGDKKLRDAKFDSSLEFLERYDFKEYDISHIHIGAHPEGHMKIPQSELSGILNNKISHIQSMGLKPEVVTQMGLSSNKVSSWLEEFSSKHEDIPLHLGTAIPPLGGFISRLQKQYSYIRNCDLEKAALYTFFRQLLSGRILGTLGTKSFPFSPSESFLSLKSDNVTPHIYGFGGLKNIHKFLSSKEKL